MTITPRGKSFLPNISIDELNDLYQKVDDTKVKIRLLAAILHKEGRTLEEISSTVKHPLTTVGDWLRSLHTEGISRKPLSGQNSCLKMFLNTHNIFLHF